MILITQIIEKKFWSNIVIFSDVKKIFKIGRNKLKEKSSKKINNNIKEAIQNNLILSFFDKFSNMEKNIFI